MGKFQNTLNNIELVLEKKRKRRTTSTPKIKSKSKSNRKDRSKNVEISNHKINKNNKRFLIHTCNAKSAEKSESSEHVCKIQIIKQTGNIDFVNCSCSDYQSRYQYYRNQEGISKYDEIVPIKDVFKPHTKEKPKITNPKNEGYMCKHLIAFSAFIND